LAREGLEAAEVVAGASDDVLERTIALIPSLKGRTLVVHPGVDVDRFHLRDRHEALRTAADMIEADEDRKRGRPLSLWAEVARVLEERKADGLDALAKLYEQGAPDQDAPELLRQTARHDGPILGYIGKLIPQKGVERLIEAATLLPANVWTLIVGFGTFREWLTALVVALDDQDQAAVDWLREQSDMQLELSAAEIRATDVPSANGAFTGKLDHRYAPYALAAMDVLVVPSTLAESFGMVAAEGAAAGALPLVSRHSGLAEVAAALETEVGRPGLFSFEPGVGATHRLAAGANTLLALPHAERRELREAASSFVAREWSWNGTAQRLLDAAAAASSPAAE
jgi:glycosyltransferase involved in cell wall biosynthesis